MQPSPPNLNSVPTPGDSSDRYAALGQLFASFLEQGRRIYDGTPPGAPGGPSLAAPAKGYGRGTILVAISPTDTGDIVWRGALEVFTDPGHQPVEQRYKRLEWAAVKLLGSIPHLPPVAPVQ